MDLSLLDQLQGAIIACNNKLNIAYYNHFCSTFFKLPPRKLKKLERVTDLFSSEQCDISELVGSALTEQVAKTSAEVKIVLLDSDLNFTVIIKAVPIDRDICILQLIDFSIEKQLFEKYKYQLNELKESHQEILTSDKLRALGELTATLGHEISNPLTVLINSVNQLQLYNSIKGENALATIIQDMHDSCFRIKKNIGNIQNFVSNQQSVLDVCSVQKIFKNIDVLISTLTAAKGIQIDIKAPKQDLWFISDALKIEQVLLNLVKNACDSLNKHNCKAPHIIVEAKFVEDALTISVVDNGQGVPEDIQDKIFEMFFTTKELGEGTGLGLAISQKFVSSFYGTLHLDTDYKDGAKFIIALPPIEMTSFSQTNKYLRGEKDSEDQKILIFGDSVDKVDAVYKMLIEQDYVLIICNSEGTLNLSVDFYLVDLILNVSERKITTESAPVIDLERGEVYPQKLLDIIQKNLGGDV